MNDVTARPNRPPIISLAAIAVGIVRTAAEVVG
jgi:hypothetical protein